MSNPHTANKYGRPHGRPSSWAVVTAAVLACATGGAALILQAWVVFSICAAAFVLCVPIAAFVGIMDDTIEWTFPQPRQTPPESGEVRAHGERPPRVEQADDDVHIQADVAG